MKSLQQIFEEVETPMTKQKTEEAVVKIWNEIMPKSRLSVSKISLGSDSNYSIFTGFIGKERSEFSNGIMQNDPLSLSFTATTKDDSITVEFKGSSLSIKPEENSHMAFGRKKIALRKFTVKNMKSFEKKMTETFTKVKKAIEESLSNGDFDKVYNDDIKKMIKSKV